MGYFPDEEGYLPNRQLDELLGLSRAIILDGELADKEIDLLEEWMDRNRSVARQPLGGDLYRLMNRLLAQRTISAAEREEVITVMNGLVGGYASNGRTRPATLPLNVPAPDLQFAGRNYCFTGTFDFGKRRLCQQAVRDRGGEVHDEVLRNTDYLIVGGQATASWKHSSFGNKIKKAVTLRDDGGSIAIVSEAHWQSQL